MTSRTGSRWRATLAAAIAALAVLPASAVAHETVITFTDPNGTNDPVSQVNRNLNISGKSDWPGDDLYVKVRRAGGGSCANTAAGDAGEYLEVANDGRYGPSSRLAAATRFFNRDIGDDEDFTVPTIAGRWVGGSGAWVFCAWIAENANEDVDPVEIPVTFRLMRAELSASLAPPTIAPGETARLTVGGTTEGAAQLSGRVRPAGAPCASRYADDPGSASMNRNVPGGPISAMDVFNNSVNAPGAYTVCLWLRTGDNAGEDTLAAQSLPLNVVVPCVVPRIVSNTLLAAATTTLAQAACAQGAVSREPSDSVARGRVIRTAPAAGTRLPAQTPIGVVISDGRWCRIPRLKRGTRLAAAKSKLRAAGCTPATRVERVRSTRRKGTVVRLSAKAGTKLAPRARVTLSVSKGARRKRR